MSANSRLTVATHILAWVQLRQQKGGEVSTSEQISGSVNTNAVVIRRLLGQMAAAGLVESRRGAGAGWRLVRAPEEITLADVYDAVEDGPLFAMHRAEPNQACPIGRGVRPALQSVYQGVEQELRDQLARTTLADVMRDILASP